MKITLADWQNSYADILAKKANNPKIEMNLRDGFPTPYEISDAYDFINLAQNSNPDEVILKVLLVDGIFAGSISATRGKNIYRRSAEIGYFLSEDMWGKGIASEGVKLIVKEVFANWPDIVRIYAEPFSRNAASCRVLEKAGFVLEAKLEKNAVKHGVIEDTKIYKLIK